MAYDPNDPADKKIVDKLIADALEAAAEDHETEVERLKGENAKARAKLREAREKGGDPDAVTKLEEQVETLSGQLRTAQKDLTKATKTVETLTGERDAATGQVKNLLVDQGLTAALTEAKVAPQFLPAVKALLLPQVALTGDGDSRKAVVGDKELGVFVKEWSQGDQGKAYVAAPANGGGGVLPQGGNVQQQQQSGKSVGRAAFEAMDPGAKSQWFAEGGAVIDDAAAA